MKIEPWLLAFMVGDAYGAGFEMQDEAFVRANNDGLTYRVHGLDTNHRPGMTTDDTQMTLAVQRTLEKPGMVDSSRTGHAPVWMPKDFAQTFLDFYRFAPAPGYGSRMREIFSDEDIDSGETIVDQCRWGTKDTCGAAMRAIPCGMKGRSVAETIYLATTQARATHHNPDSIDAAIVVALTVYASRELFVPGIGPGWMDWAPKFVGWRNPFQWDPKDWPRGTSSGKHVVQAALGLLCRYGQRGTLHELLVHSVALGGDVDTLAALVLGIGVLAKIPNDLPDELLKGLIRPNQPE